MTDHNENRPGYKKTPVGWIPEEWTISRLGNIAYINYVSLCENTNPDYQFFYIDLGSIQEGAIELPKEKIRFSEAPYRARRVVKKGDVLLATVRPNLRGFGYIDFNAVDLICSTGFSILTAKDNCHGHFLYYSLYSSETSKYFHDCVVGSGYPALNNSDVNHLKIPFPPLPQQKKIAEILSTWDEAIEQNRTLIAATKRRKKALMQKLLTGKKRLKGFEGKWKERLLGDLFTERAETNRPDLPLLAITAGRGIVPASELDRKDASNKDKSSYRRICPGDIGYNTMRMWQGVNAVSQMGGIVSPAYTICTPRTGISVEFMRHLFKFQPMVHLFWKHSQGLVNDTLSLKYHHFARITVQVPDENEQRAIAAVLAAAADEIAALESKLEALEKQKRGLMQKLLTGEVRVIERGKS